jgi:hypothetical protein
MKGVGVKKDDENGLDFVADPRPLDAGGFREWIAQFMKRASYC